MKTEEIMKYAMYAAGAYFAWVFIIEPMLNKATTSALSASQSTAVTTVPMSGVGAIATPLRKMPARRSMSFGGNGVGAIVDGLNPVGSETIQ